MSTTLEALAAYEKQHATEHRAKRIDRALKLIAKGKVEIISPTKARVQSETGGHHYTVNGTCPCDDAIGRHANSTPDGWCKHKIAVQLLRESALVRKLDWHARDTQQLTRYLVKFGQKYHSAQLLYIDVRDLNVEIFYLEQGV